MRFLIPAAATLALLAVPALAQTTTTTTTAAPAAAAPAVAAPAVAPPATATPAAPKKMVGHKQTLQQHFDMANSTHDGHLTKDQATAAKWSYVAKNFAAMDATKKGFVTVDDIHAYAHTHHVSHKKPAAAPAVAPATNS